MQTTGFKLRQLADCLSMSALLLAPMLVRAQIAGAAKVQGTVTDSSGAVIPNAAVNLTDEATGIKHVTRSDGSGVQCAEPSRLRDSGRKSV